MITLEETNTARLKSEQALQDWYASISFVGEDGKVLPAEENLPDDESVDYDGDR